MAATPVPPNSPDHSLHPCFHAGARSDCGRIHLPVASKCNIQCNYCSRKYDCANETRPGVASAILTPEQALNYLERALQRMPAITVAGIAGPGDAFANWPETRRTLELVRRRFPQMLLCVATNGLGLPAVVADLAELAVTHVTVTINAVDPVVGGRIYAWVRDGNVIYRGQEAARVLLERQLSGVAALLARGVAVKVNTIVIPGVNDAHVGAVAIRLAKLGVKLMNCMPLAPAPGTPFGAIAEPDAEYMRKIRQVGERYLPQISHCARCRADAAGFLGVDHPSRFADLLAEAAAAPLHPGESRPNLAVASREGVLVNWHLGEATHFLVYTPGADGYKLLERRPAPAPGGGRQRWLDVAKTLGDCHTLLVSGVGESPRTVLTAAGLHVVETTELVAEALAVLHQGGALRNLPRREWLCGASCRGAGRGCS